MPYHLTENSLANPMLLSPSLGRDSLLHRLKAFDWFSNDLCLSACYFPDPVREWTIRTGLCIFTANSLSRFPRLCIWTTATSSQLDSLPLVSAVPCATDAMLHIQDHTACQWWCWNSNLNLSYLRNKSTRKEKGLKLIFTTVFPMWTTTLSPFSCCFLTIINPRPVISSALSCRALQPELSSLSTMSWFTTSHDMDLIFLGLTLLLGKNPYFPNHPAPYPMQSLVSRFD